MLPRSKVSLVHFSSFQCKIQLVADHAGHLFCKMFLKCEEVKLYGCGRTKTAAIINEMVKQHEMSVLQTVPFYLSIDGSN
ncbi:hypothetical protein PR048_020782 [Dryococelus australis]|uniref:Uncharacterized protein n=1 Tax=Dryococelus australis TaxID=614101 RepID=A0ABQ9GWD8_9NEOP|nr:hypothetical protein PR048_020782 [Dryococelus australis]